MKLPRYSLRFLLIAIAVIATITAVICQMRKGWTVAKVERVIEAEFKPEWDEKQTLRWLQSKGFHTTSRRAVPHDEFEYEFIQASLADLDRRMKPSTNSFKHRLASVGENEVQYGVISAWLGPDDGTKLEKPGYIDIDFYFANGHYRQREIEHH